MTDSPQQVLERVFGYPAFRGEQAAIIDTLVAGDDALVLMPTGGGKSLCYQIPALCREGCGVVISPLIALMQDQVNALRELGVRAGFLNSTLPADQAAATEQALREGRLDLLYVAPERLNQPRTLDLLHQSPIALFAIDEAHCVSQWGHDFRSDYLELGTLHEQFPSVPRIALTATADTRTREEIARRLDLAGARHYVASFDRPNIQYRITQKTNARQQLLRFLKKEHAGDAGIVYCLSRKKVEATAHWLREQGFNAYPYHAGLPAEDRKLNQERFLREEGVIIVATIAFGMGIDKPDVRFVAHLDLPKSIESYYQETGRAGRDGLPATAWMAYGLQDVIKLRQMMENNESSEEHKRSERHKLDAMLGLCEITSCRRQVLLRYFGEDLPQPCGNCDTCLTPVETWDATEPVRMALSCVYRTGQRFGVNHVIDVLRGGENEKIRQFDHQKLSTWGIGKDLSNNQWRSVFRQLVARGYLHVDVEGYGALHLTESCRAVLRGEESMQLREDAREVVEKTSRRAASKDIAIPEEDKPLWHALRACRKRLADEHGVPPYVIFHDATLMDMIVQRPMKENEMLSVSGVGESKLEKYGAEFLEVIREHEYGGV
jgi:ATP-dependent DNA helicase RecQ